ncbi:MAG: ATP-binding protein, partial [Desulfobacterales bacterium]
LKKVELGWRQAADHRIEIFVRDNGIGIEPRFHEGIFRIFKRLHTDCDYGGTGIGLAIVRRAAQKIGGSLRVESTLGEGSTFYLGLPESIIDRAHP